MNVKALMIVETWLDCRNLMLLELLKLDVESWMMKMKFDWWIIETWLWLNSTKFRTSMWSCKWWEIELCDDEEVNKIENYERTWEKMVENG